MGIYLVKTYNFIVCGDIYEKNIIMNIKKDNIYVYVWEEFNTVYVGRTVNPKSRHYHHKHFPGEKTYQFSSEHGVEHPKMIIIENDLTVEEGVEREKYWIDKYKNDGIYNVLNKSCGGQCGRKKIYSNEEIKEHKKEYYLSNRETISKHQKEYYATHKERYKQYYIDHKEEISLKIKEYKYSNREKLLAKKKDYYNTHKEEILSKRKEYRDEHKLEIKKYQEANKDKLKEYQKAYRNTHKKNKNI